VPNDIDEYLKRIVKHDGTLIIPIDNDVAGRKQGQKKARKAHTCGIKHVRIFDIATVWPECAGRNGQLKQPRCDPRDRNSRPEFVGAGKEAVA
jgi:hypothetical protein